MQKINKLPLPDFITITLSICLITILCWYYLIDMANDMSGMAMEAMEIHPWNMSYFVMMFLMWSIMMAGMMLPSVTPTVLIYAAVARKAVSQSNPIAPTGVFIFGYLVVWVLFSFIATGLQWILSETALLSPMMVSNSSIFGGAILIMAGLFQLLPFKNSCLKRCRSPVEFISQNWKPGKAGAFKLGISHGLFCLGCCWALMILLFVGGVMNLLWVGALTIFVLLEKVLPHGDHFGRASGILFIIAGIFIFYKGI